MLLALDIGNTNIVIGISVNGDWQHRWRIQTNANKTADEYRILFKHLFKEADKSFKQFSQIIIGSVVPKLTQTIEAVFTHKNLPAPLIISPKMETGIAISTESPQTVGADLIADAAGAYDLVNDNCIVVDFGTATTITAVQKPGELTGVAICAGLNVTVDALAGKAAQLTQIPLEPPQNVLGKSTRQAMQSGLVLGHICMVEGLIDRMRKEIGPAQAIATGGLSQEIGQHSTYFDVIDPMLTLDGLRLIGKRQGEK